MSLRIEPSGATSQPIRKETRMEQLWNIAVFAVFVVLWAAFAYALVANQAGIDNAWKWLGSLPLIVQAGVALLTLPVYAGLWIWESAWPLVVRLTLIVGIGGWNLWLFFPRAPIR